MNGMFRQFVQAEAVQLHRMQHSPRSHQAADALIFMNRTIHQELQNQSLITEVLQV